MALLQVSVCPGGVASGYTYFIPQEEHLESSVVTRGYMEARLVVGMAGRLVAVVCRLLTQLAHHFHTYGHMTVTQRKNLLQFDLLYDIPQPLQNISSYEHMWSMRDVSDRVVRLSLMSGLICCICLRAHAGRESDSHCQQKLLQLILKRARAVLR